MPPVAPTPRPLARLDDAITRTRDPLARACLQAERAAFLARQGQTAAARVAVAQLQRQFGAQPQAGLSAWLALVQGLIDHYQHLGPAARDRMQRAHALSAAPALRRVHALAAAWLAHLDYTGDDMARMAQHLREALRNADADDHATRSRAALVAAEAYHHAGRADTATAWYARSRHHAQADGDSAHLSALMHNQAWLRASALRQQALLGDASGAGGALTPTLLSAESVAHFDAVVGTASLDALVPMLRAQICTLAGRYDDARRLFDAHFDAAMHQGLGAQRAPLLADWAWCAWQLREPDAALRDAQAAEEALPDCELDDRALAQARLAQLWQAAGDGARARTLRAAAERDHAQHRVAQAQLAALLDQTLADIDVASA
jgi:hypothetical protein